MSLNCDGSEGLRIFNIGGPQTLNSTIGYSGASWCRPTFASDATFHTLIHWGQSAVSEQYFLGVGADGGTNYRFNVEGNTAGTLFATTSAVTQNDWFFVVGTIQGTAANIWAWHYTNGQMVQLAAGSSGSAAATADTTSTVVSIGETAGNAARWVGQIHGVTMWRSALTQQEAQAMAYGASPRTVRPSTIIFDINLNMSGYTATAVQGYSSARGDIQQANVLAQATSGVGSTPENWTNAPISGLLPYVADTVYGANWDSNLPIISQTARRPFPLPLQGIVATPVASTIDFRKTLSGIGGRIGARQIQGYMNG